MLTGQSNFLHALGWAVLNSLWQMALLWVVFSLLTGLFKPRPGQKAALASGLLISGFAWFLFTFFSILTIATPHSTAIATGMVDTSGNARLYGWLETMVPMASLLYLILLILPVYNYIRNYRYVQVIRNTELSKMEVDWRIFVRNVSAHMGIVRPVQIWISGLVTSPVTIGYLKPVILVPLAAINHLSSNQMEAVLLHELAHIRRQDYLLNLVMRFIQSILYFNPFVKALVKTIEREREKSCDDMVLQFQYDPHTYASALLTIEKNNHFPRPFAVAASGKRNDLLHRVEWLLGIRKQVLTFNKLAGVMAGLLCFIGLNALIIASRPVKTEKPVAGIANMYSPFYFFTGDIFNTPPASEPVVSESLPIFTHARTEEPMAGEPVANVKKNELPAPPAPPAVEDPKEPGVAAQYQFVNYLETVLPELSKQQEEEMEKALNASKKVMEEMQWRAMEEKIADAMSSNEKAWVKSQYEKEVKRELSRVNWEELENNLRIAYDQIDWKSINGQLNGAMARIKLDSLQNVYNMALSELSALQSELAKNELTGVPDTDITLGLVEKKQQEVKEAIHTIKAIKTRKIVNL